MTRDTQAANGGGSLGWSAFLRYLVVSAMVLALLLYAFILVLDPYQNVPFSPSLPRAPVAQNQRFSYPALARDGDFDGLVLGTSTLRLIDPAALGAGLGVPFFNLSMNSATAHEQHELGRLALRHHAHLRYLVIGVDEVWCSRREDLADYTFRAFPAWMYDEDRWNDLPYLFNDKALEDALRMLELLAGWRAPKYGRDGYHDFTADFPVYDAAAVRQRLHAGTGSGAATAPGAVLPAFARSRWRFPALDTLDALLAAVPAGTRVVLLLPPLHAAYLARRAPTFAECKGRLAARLAADPRLRGLDYLFESPVTSDDTNYWDPVHHTRAVAARIEADLVTVLAGGEVARADVRMLAPRAAPVGLGRRGVRE